MNVELYYFDDCPSYEKALANLKEGIRAEGLPQSVTMVEVVSEEDAQTKRLIGSPTIRIDGIDVEGPEADERGYAFGCRVYSDNGSIAGWPAVETIRAALRNERPAAARGDAEKKPAEGETPSCCR